MKMNCMDALEKALNNGGMPDVETLEHINMCPHCKRLGDDWAELSAVNTGEEKEIPRELEESILSTAHCYAEKRSRRAFTLLKWPLISSAAACLVFSLTTLLYMNLQDAARSTGKAKYISFDEKWKAIDMTDELNELKNKIDAQISELESPSLLIDMSRLAANKSTKNIS